ncbi:MAG: response regulator transcription factor, partial [Candidatus Limnocylindria bacterium]
VRSLARFAPAGAADASAAKLTPRQRQIVNLIAMGATDREIADLLHISRSTAHKHVQNALRRTHTKTRSQLAASTRDPWVAYAGMGGTLAMETGGLE